MSENETLLWIIWIGGGFLLGSVMFSRLMPRLILKKDIAFLDDIQTEMATARQFLLIGRCRNLKPEQVFNTANRIEKVVSEQGFETHRLKKAEIKRFLAVFFEASMNGDQMPDTDGEQFFDGEDSDEEET